MMELLALQEAFQRFVLADARGIEQQISTGRHGDHEERLRIYFDAYRLRLVEALTTDYEALHARMGDAAFRAMGFAYVDDTRSSWRNVRWYGGRLADFLATHAPWRDEPELSECARFEWTLTLAFDAADEAHVTCGTIAGVPPDAWPHLRFRLHPSAHIIALRSNAHALRSAVDAGAALPAPAWSEHPVDWLIWRKSDSVRFRSLAGLESIALRAAAAGSSFSEICTALVDYVADAEVATYAAGFLRAWLDDALIAAVSDEGLDDGIAGPGNEKPALQAGS